MTKYTVEAGHTQDQIKNDGFDVSYRADTLQEAKARARYLLSDEYRRASEASTRLGYAHVINAASECVADYFNEVDVEEPTPSTPTHTPGPWTLEHSSAKRGPGGLCGTAAFNRVVGDGMELATGIQREANARLIAAAPDLLEALKWVQARLIMHEGASDANDAASVAITLASAITKATA